VAGFFYGDCYVKIWVDADACPKAIRDILFRVAERTKTEITFVANQRVQVPPSGFISTIQVEQGPDAADHTIVELCAAGDLVVTADIPLAARIIEKGGQALDPRGKSYDAENIGHILSMRDFMDSLRGSGIDSGGPDSFGARERQNFANLLDQIVTRARR
jgi:uncharacterized protein YaiI (UPF0178 family)